MCHSMYGGQRTTCRNRFSPSTNIKKCGFQGQTLDSEVWGQHLDPLSQLAGLTEECYFRRERAEGTAQ